jgi:general secretion pathway protein A
VLNPMLSPAEFLEFALTDFGITEVPPSKAQRLTMLRSILLEAHRVGRVSVLVVDEAHKLSPEVQEEIRLLSNFEMADCKLLQIVLAGQNELRHVLNREDMRQLKQRIAVRLSISALSLPEIGHYIQHRWNKAGATAAHPFSPEAVQQIARFSTGIPRLINAICDNVLMLAYGEGVGSITPAHVAEVAKDLDLDLAGPRRQPVAMADRSRTGRPPADWRGPNPVGAPRGVNGRAPADRVAPRPISAPVLERFTEPKPSFLSRLAGRFGRTS